MKIMKQHLRTKYEKYRSYNDEDLERSILSFLNEYVIEMKTKEDEGNPLGDQMLELHDQYLHPGEELNQTLSSNRPDADVAEFEYGNTARTLVNSTLDWNDQDKIAKRIQKQIELTKGRTRMMAPGL